MARSNACRDWLAELSAEKRLPKNDPPSAFHAQFSYQHQRRGLTVLGVATAAASNGIQPSREHLVRAGKEGREYGHFVLQFFDARANASIRFDALLAE